VIAMLHDTCLETSKQDITWYYAGYFFRISTLKTNNATNFRKVLLLPKMSTFFTVKIYLLATDTHGHFALPTWQGKNNTYPRDSDNLSAGVSTSG
jgi:catechol-2,3-dioxygenase